MVQGGEWIVIFLVALVVFGPERLPDLARKLGGWARELRTVAREMREGLEAEISEVQKAKSDLADPIREVRQAVRDTARLVADTKTTRMTWNGPKPLSGPTPEDALRDLERIEKGESPVEESAIEKVASAEVADAEEASAGATHTEVANADLPDLKKKPN